MRHLFYKLDGHTPVPCDAMDLQDRGEPIARTVLMDGTIISTVFLGIDHSWATDWADPTPILFETMVFQEGQKYDQYQERYSTWDQAEQGHLDIVKMVAGEDEWVEFSIQKSLDEVHKPVDKR